MAAAPATLADPPAETGEAPAPAPPKLYDLPLEDLVNIQFTTVYSASRREQNTWEAPSSVSIVAREEIKTFGYRTLADVIRSAPGIYFTDDRYYTHLGIRGFNRPGDYNSRMLLLIDGHRANDNIYESALIGQEALIEVDDIERVEIIRGPSSSLYGSSAFFGVINVISRSGRQIQGAEASVEAGSQQTYKGRLTAGQKLESGLEFMVSGTYFETEGEDRLYYPEFDSPQSNYGVAEDLDYTRAWHLLSSVSYHDFTLSGAFNYRTRGIPTGSFGSQFNDPRAQVWDRAWYLDLKYERDLPSDVHLLARTGYHHYDYRGDYPYNAAAPGDPANVILNKDEANGDSTGAEVLATKTFFDQLTVSGGLEARYNFRQDQENFDQGPPRIFYVRDESDSVVLGVYAQGDWAIRTNLIFSAGVRYDYYSSFGDTVNPRLGVMYRPWNPTTWKLLYGRAFRAPNAYETDYIAPGYQSNPNLRAETIQTVEGVWEQVVVDPIRTTASAFFYDVDDLIELDIANGFFQSRNLSSVRAYGAELGVEGRWENGWFARVSYTAQRTKDEDTNEEISNAPRHLAKFHLRIPLAGERLFAGAELLYVGSVHSVQPGRVDGYWLANLTLFSREIFKGVEMSATIYNLFDADYAVTGGDEHLQRELPQDGRSFRVKLTYHF